MSVNRVLRWCVPVACLLVAGLSATCAEAGPLVAQPNLTQAVAPATVGFHRWGGRWGYGYGSYRGYGSYYYGRPALYYSGYGGYGGYGGYYRPYYSSYRYNYAPAYSYGYSSPYYQNSYYSTPYCSNCSTDYSSYTPVSYYQPAVYSQPVVYSPPVVYSQPVAYAQPAYSAGYYVSSAPYYSGYSRYSYPGYRSINIGVGGFGYSSFSPYYSSSYYGGYW